MSCEKKCEHKADCRECEKTKGYMYESAIMRHEAHEKRLWILIVIMILIFLLANFAWLGYLAYRTSILDDLEISHIEESEISESETESSEPPETNGEIL